MQKLKQRGKNPDYPKEAILWAFSDELPDWISDNFKVYINQETGETELVMRETTRGFELLLSSGTQFNTRVDKEKSGGMLYSKTHPIIYLTEKQISLLYDKKEL